MKCERCSSDEATATYRVFTGMIDMKVCAACADEAWKLGINVRPLILSKGKTAAKRFDQEKETTAIYSSP